MPPQQLGDTHLALGFSTFITLSKSQAKVWSQKLEARSIEKSYEMKEHRQPLDFP